MARLSTGAYAPTTAPKNAATREIELGITNVMAATSWNNWWNGTPKDTITVGRDPTAPTQEELIAMLRRDGQARALFRLITLPLRTAFTNGKWIEPEDGGKTETDFANQMWKLPSGAGGMSIPSSMFMQQVLLAIPYGFSAFEIVRKIPKDGPLKGKLVIKKLSFRDQRTINFVVDDHGNYMGMHQRTTFANRYIDVYMKPEDTFFYTNSHDENPFYGVSAFEPAFKHYQIKWNMYYIGNLAAQFAAVPGRIGEVPVGAPASQIRSFKRDIENFAFNTAMLAPPNFKVSSFNGNSNFDFLKLIDHQNTQMAKSFLAQFLQEENAHVIIRSGSTDPSADMFIRFLEAIANELAELFTTKLMAPFIDANFGTGKYPVFKFGPLTDSDKDLLIQLFTAIASATTLNITPEFARQLEKALSARLGFEIDYNEIEKNEAIAVQRQQEMMDKGLDPNTGQPLQPPAAPGNNSNPNAPGQKTAAPNSNSAGYTNQYSKAGSPQNPKNNVGLSDRDQRLSTYDAAVIALSEIVNEVPEDVLPVLQEAIDGREILPEAEEI